MPARRPAKNREKTKKGKPKQFASTSAKRVARPIDAALKTLVIAAEPPRDNNPLNLDAAFRGKLDAALAQLSGPGTPFRFVEGFRTVDRQQWLYGSGRPSAVPYGRPGPILTNADGVNTLSKHQGNGTAGSGLAADCYPLKGGSVYIPPDTDPVWDQYASAVVAQDLVAGRNFPKFKDSPHCEMP